MTSKEIIEKKIKLLAHDFLVDGNYYYELQLKEYKQVLKDLEILEIIKNKIHLRREFDTWKQNRIMCFYGTLSEEEQKKIEGWLNGD